MGFRTIILAGASVVALSAIATPAFAVLTIQTNQWYTGAFNSTVGSALYGPGTILGTNPTAGSNATVLFAPEGSTWTTADLRFGGTLTVLDTENSGDFFDITVNGIDQGNTSAPLAGSNCNADIGCAYANSDFSRGTFALADGTNTFGGIYAGATYSPAQGGMFNFIIQANAAPDEPTPAPEPATMAIVGVGLAGLGFVRGRRR